MLTANQIETELLIDFFPSEEPIFPKYCELPVEIPPVKCITVQ